LETLKYFKAVTPATVVSYSALGMIHRLLVTGAETDGAYSTTEIVVAHGAGVPLHRHAGLEAFYVLEGTFAFRVGNNDLNGTTGDYVTIPPMIFHMWQNIGDGNARVLCLLAPGGMEQMFVEGSHLVTDNSAPPLAPTPEDAERTTQAVLKYGVEFPAEQPHDFPPRHV